MKCWMVFSLVARNLSVGVWTLPVLSVVYLPLWCLAAVVRARVRFMPYSQSISCRVCAASICV